MKAKIYRTLTGEVVVFTPAGRYQKIGVEHCKHPWRFHDDNPDKEEFTMEVMDFAEIAIITDGKNEVGNDQFYYNGNTLKHDTGWNELLMPKSSIVQKHMKRLEKRFDAELAKPNPDAVSVVRLERDRKLFHKKPEKEIYQQALINLNEDGHDKPKIRQKLQAKIESL